MCRHSWCLTTTSGKTQRGKGAGDRGKWDLKAQGSGFIQDLGANGVPGWLSLETDSWFQLRS